MHYERNETTTDKTEDFVASLHADSYVNGNRVTTCLEILAGPNPAIMASKVAVIICREDKDSGMAEEFIRILESQAE